jgi:Uma2 family endonuclease
MISLQSLSDRLKADDPEERQIISGVSWLGYEALLSELGDSLQYRVTYLDGVLELVSPRRRHERNKTIIGSLVEAYCQEKRIPYFPLGSTTFRREEKQGGTEPDESYCIGTDKEFPDLAIEVVVTSGGLNKLEVYQRLGVREVWFFKKNQFEIYHLRSEGYEQTATSEVLPDIDLTILAQCAIAPDPLEAVLEFRERVRTSSLNPD